MASNDVISKEVDARFWMKGYKPGQKLDPNDPKDRAQIPLWNQIHDAVVAEATSPAGLTVTYTKPEVVQAIKDMAIAQATAAAHLNAAATTGDPTHSQAAATALAVSDVRAGQGAAHQPASVDPATAAAAASAVAATPSRTAHDHVAATVAARAPANAAAHQQHAAQNPPPPSAVDPLDLAAMVTKASQLAASATGDFVGVSIVLTGSVPSVAVFPSLDKLGEWFNHGVTKEPVHGVYLAAFSKHDPSWPHPLADGFSGEAALLVTGHADKKSGGASTLADGWNRFKGVFTDVEKKVESVVKPFIPSPSSAPAGLDGGAIAGPPLPGPEGHGLSTGDKVGIALGVVAVVGLVGFAAAHKR